MATARRVAPEPVEDKIILELTVPEAKYVTAALCTVNPSVESGLDESDPVYLQLLNAVDDDQYFQQRLNLVVASGNVPAGTEHA